MMVMKMVSLGFDVDSRTDRHGEKRPPSIPKVPNFAEYTSYCIFPSTTIFGPFLTFNEHKKFLSPSPLVCICMIHLSERSSSSTLSVLIELSVVYQHCANVAICYDLFVCLCLCDAVSFQ